MGIKKRENTPFVMAPAKVWNVWILEYDGEPIENKTFSSEEKYKDYIKNWVYEWYEEYFELDDRKEDWKRFRENTIPNRIKSLEFDEDFAIQVYENEVL